MLVFIDGDEYVKRQDVPKEQIDKLDAILYNHRFDSDAGKNLTIAEYLKTLLETLWKEQEGFSGKRPFGNSGWEYDLYMPLIKYGYVDGKIDGDGYIEDFDNAQANQLIMDCIKRVFMK